VFHTRSAETWDPLLPTLGSFPAVNQPKRGVNRPPESSAEANNDCGCGCSPAVCLVRHVMG
jgi:hypothetical protein